MVTYNGKSHDSSLLSPTQIELFLAPSDVSTVGNYPIIVDNPSPGGGASSPVNFAVVTGTPSGFFDITLTATSGPITHTSTVHLTVQ